MAWLRQSTSIFPALLSSAENSALLPIAATQTLSCSQQPTFAKVWTTLFSVLYVHVRNVAPRAWKHVSPPVPSNGGHKTGGRNSTCARPDKRWVGLAERQVFNGQNHPCIFFYYLLRYFFLVGVIHTQGSVSWICPARGFTVGFLNLSTAAPSSLC